MKLILLSILLFSAICNAKTIRVAVIDTGISSLYMDYANLCKSGHISFIPNQGIEDRVNHGTNIIGLINKTAGNADYCIIVIKFYSDINTNTLDTIISSLKYAYKLKPDIINISAGGIISFNSEKTIVKKILDANIKLITAAGNELSNLDEKCNYYPACYDKRIWVVGAKDVIKGNYGKVVDVYINGIKRTAYGITMSGTSQSTAIFTGRVIKNLSRDRQ